jgi:transcriptional regulator with XRE-family HTH domain
MMTMRRLKAERLKRRWTQLDLAARSRVQPADISKFENGYAVPYPPQAARLARALRVRATTLLDLVPPTSAPPED